MNHHSVLVGKYPRELDQTKLWHPYLGSQLTVWSCTSSNSNTLQLACCQRSTLTILGAADTAPWMLFYICFWSSECSKYKNLKSTLIGWLPSHFAFNHMKVTSGSAAYEPIWKLQKSISPLNHTLDHRSGPSHFPDLWPNLSQVYKGSGSNLSSGLNCSSTSQHHIPVDNKLLPWSPTSLTCQQTCPCTQWNSFALSISICHSLFTN